MQLFHSAQSIHNKAKTANANNASVAFALNAAIEIGNNVVNNINVVLVVLVQIIRFSRGRLLA